MARAHAQLRVSELSGRTVVTEATSRTPLRLLQPRNHGHAAWVFQSSHGGGMVGGDDVSLDVEVEERGTLFLSSQAASRIYARADARLSLDAKVQADAALVLWPDALSCFRGATLEQTLRFHLHERASLVSVDPYSAGRVAHGERWAFERMALRTTLDIAGARVLNDALVLSPRHGDIAARLGGYDAFATVVIAGAPVVAAAHALHASLQRAPLGRPLVTSSAWPWGAVVRVAARDTQALAATLQSLLRAHVSALLGDDPWERKW